MALCPVLTDWLCGLTLIEKLGEGGAPDPDDMSRFCPEQTRAILQRGIGNGRRRISWH